MHDAHILLPFNLAAILYETFPLSPAERNPNVQTNKQGADNIHFSS
jgi:hypothetical protein